MSRYRSSKPMTRRGKIALCVFTLIFGLILATVGCVVIGGYIGEKNRCTFETQGVVVELKAYTTSSRKSSHRTSYHPVYSYEYNGQTYTHTDQAGSNPPAFTAGQRLTIMVNPDDPTEIYVPDSKAGWFVGGAFAAIGLVVMLVSFIILIRILKRPDKYMTIEDELKEYSREREQTRYPDPDDYFK